MEEYTYDNVIINPTQEDVESLIGKEVYFQDNPWLCLKCANRESASNLGILVEIQKKLYRPIHCKTKRCLLCTHLHHRKKGRAKA